MIFANKGCAANGCHDGTATESANFDMATAGWQDHLLGVNPRGGGTLSACVASDGPYLTAGSNPATGLFIRKISGTGNLCTGGVRMPFGMPSAYLTAAQITCVTQWATTLTHP
jgi:hypothetical protein